MDLSDDAAKPRQSHVIKWPDFDGYGFNLHAEKSRSGQFIGKVDDESPAQYAGLKEGDRIVEVNGVNIANENHRQVVERIKSIPNETKLLVVDEETDKWFKLNKMLVKSTHPNVIYIKTPVPRPTNSTVNFEKSVTETNGNYIENTDNISAKIIVEDIDDGMPLENNGANTPRSSTPQSDKLILESETEPPAKDEDNNDDNNASTPVSQSGSSGQDSNLDQSDLNLNMSALQMRQILAQRKKNDPKKAQIDLKQKYQIIQQM